MDDSASWIETDADDNAQSTAVRAAATGLCHYVTHISAGYSGTAANKLLELLDGSTVKARWYITTTSLNMQFDPGIRMTTGNSCTARLAASGTGGVTSAVNIAGYTDT